MRITSWFSRKSWQPPALVIIAALLSFGCGEGELKGGFSPPGNILTQLMTLPHTATVTVGDTLQFTSRGQTQAGDTLELPSLYGVRADYSTNGGTIFPNGEYIAPGKPGTYQVVVSSRGLADTATVIVRGRTLVIPTPELPTFEQWWMLLTFPLSRYLIDIPPERREIGFHHIKLVPVLITLLLVAFTGTKVFGSRWPHRFPNRRAASRA